VCGREREREKSNKLFLEFVSLILLEKDGNEIGLEEIVQEEGFVPVLIQQFQCLKAILTDFSNPQQYVPRYLFLCQISFYVRYLFMSRYLFLCQISLFIIVSDIQVFQK
jgi:hypothetical protein